MVGVLTLNVGGLPSVLSSALAPAALRAAELGPRIEACGADVVALQEVWSRRLLGVLRAGLPSFGALAWRPGPAGQPAGGLVTFSRLPLAAVTFTCLGGIRPDAGGWPFRLAKAVNSRLQGVLTCELAGRRTVVGNVHLSANRDGDWSAGNRHHGFQRAQVAAMHAALERAAGGAELAVLAGDLNIPSGAPLYPLVTGQGTWHDPFAGSDPPTYHADLLPPGRTPSRIDYLLVRGDPRYHPAAAGTLFADRVRLPGGRHTHLSDHLALLAHLPLPGSAGDISARSPRSGT